MHFNYYTTPNKDNSYTPVNNKAREKAIGIAAGYKAVSHPRGLWWYSYVKGEVRVWPIHSGWQNALLINGRFCCHAPQETLEEALAVVRSSCIQFP